MRPHPGNLIQQHDRPFRVNNLGKRQHRLMPALKTSSSPIALLTKLFGKMIQLIVIRLTGLRRKSLDLQKPRTASPRKFLNQGRLPDSSPSPTGHK